ncbi:glycine zipper 2TM domain-containing protein [Neptunomonas phycophila]|jgi:outer membrane lipoprotein SlyB|uniref:Glycine zipper 2TM domain-containing protein n=1 Tax=Neptunomonas phycophila TaxID=1572645 RepID=A0AAW7XMZ8_9GAMM|nr:MULTISPECIES: glycine zipper 2TM domain-containing protein [Neptunomonas]MBT3146405.1 glycine zipper 2TM domain-containing protein [Neptunomonas phycophila]MDN2658683.1 glycine zipper 2TM domain-containing protein [Neptunomonas sp. CHC150]MDO6454728.1 glycine zipper 2TM domain-containing protein [Neptunomonas phycophila]MDO6469122.1 glycine zipper 2TM domain-containing protein [Neptunomonas phycophila]MDO6785144.1 glycine zipper 2TM domain-containing protein [Neptunomonas phycophila]
MVKHKVLGAVVVASVLLTGCASPSLTGTTYSQKDARQVQQVRYGTVTSVTPVVIEGRQDGIVGGGAGTIVGALAGSSVGGGKGSSIAAVLGAVAGGVLGSKLEESATRKQGQEVTLRMADGQEISVVQEVENQQFFRVGDQIRLLQRGGTTRITY